jgi:hypothetical protein
LRIEEESRVALSLQLSTNGWNRGILPLDLNDDKFEPPIEMAVKISQICQRPELDEQKSGKKNRKNARKWQ